ncbi:MAG: OmpH family outer membrane protein, partial [Armatimonadetes bacterium]|nr:OmpH family outer membrane protein [Armatimonadota bacterium]
TLFCSLAAVILALGLSPALAAAADLKMAVVDIDSISAQYTELTSRQAELGAWVQDKKSYLASMQDFMFVSGEEFQEASRIYQVARAQWTDEQKKREAELRKISGDNEKKFLDLQAKPARTAEEQNQFSTLRDTFQARDRDLKAISAEFDKQLKQKRDEVQTKLVASVRAVIEKVSKDKGYQLVIDKSAVYFIAAPIDDITAEVLKSLNAGGATTPGAANGNPPKPQ